MGRGRARVVGVVVAVAVVAGVCLWRRRVSGRRVARGLREALEGVERFMDMGHERASDTIHILWDALIDIEGKSEDL